MAMNRTPIEDTARRPPRPQQRGPFDPSASELKSMTNGYQIDSYTAFPFIWQRRHPPTNSQYAIKAAVLWHTASGGSVGPEAVRQTRRSRVHDQEATNVSPATSSHAAPRRRDGNLERALVDASRTEVVGRVLFRARRVRRCDRRSHCFMRTTISSQRSTLAHKSRVRNRANFAALLR